MRRLLIGTNNPAKVNEFKRLLAPLQITCLTPREMSIPDNPEEDSPTIEENSLIKANFFWQRANLPVITDDTAFEIDALNGEPGVHIRRWLGHRMTDQEIRAEIIRRTSNLPEKRRGAQLRSIVTIRVAPDRNFQAIGITRGTIRESQLPIEEEGFPIEPIFWIRELQKYYGELTEDERRRLGSRSVATQQLFPYIQQYV